MKTVNTLLKTPQQAEVNSRGTRRKYTHPPPPPPPPAFLVFVFVFTLSVREGGGGGGERDSRWSNVLSLTQRQDGRTLKEREREAHAGLMFCHLHRGKMGEP